MSKIQVNEKQMTVSEVADVLNVTPKTVRKYVSKMFPDLMNHGQSTWLNEIEVTAIKLELDKNPHLNRSVSVPKTELEETLLIQQAQNILLKRVVKLQSQVDSQRQELVKAQPKIEFHDQVGDSEGLYTIGEVAKTMNLGYGRNTLFKKLRDRRIFFKTEPYQPYIDSGYFEVKTTTVNERIQKQAYVTPKGLQWLQKNQTRFSLSGDE